MLGQTYARNRRKVRPAKLGTLGELAARLEDNRDYYSKRISPKVTGRKQGGRRKRRYY